MREQQAFGSDHALCQTDGGTAAAFRLALLLFCALAATLTVCGLANASGKLRTCILTASSANLRPGSDAIERSAIVVRRQLPDRLVLDGEHDSADTPSGVMQTAAALFLPDFYTTPIYGSTGGIMRLPLLHIRGILNSSLPARASPDADFIISHA